VGRDLEQRGSGSFDAYAAARTPALLRFAFLISRDRQVAEDLVQEAMSRAFQRWARIRRTDDPDVYVRKAVLNQLLSWRRRAGWTREIAVADAPSLSAAGTGDPADEQAERDVMWRMLATLSPQQRAVLVLRYYEDLDDHEIGRILSCSPATVRAHASRALGRLRAPQTQPVSAVGGLT